jgi:4-diphosphocytidyl-2-C-methyl-D-erythritol kinase
MIVTARSFAKINLGLRIGAARADGFHELLTVYQTIGLHDLIRVTVARGSGTEIRCNDPRVPTDGSNTCWRIVEKAMDALRAKGRVIIDIEKRLPVKGGMGGASANAVTALLALERALKKSLSATERLRIAAEVGSDVPLFLIGGTVLGLGRGERVYPLEDFPATACVVVTPEVGVSTPKAFAEWDRRRGLKPGSSREANAALKGRSSTVGTRNEFGSGAEPGPRAEFGSRADRGTGKAGLRPAGQPGAAVPTKAALGDDELTMLDASDRMNLLGREMSAWLSESYSGAPGSSRAERGRAENPPLALVRAGIKNDFEEVVFPEYPELSEGKKALERAGAKYASLSGSGSTLYGLFASKEAAGAAVEKLRKQGWAAQATTTLTRRQYWKRMWV